MTRAYNLQITCDICHTAVSAEYLTLTSAGSVMDFHVPCWQKTPAPTLASLLGMLQRNVNAPSDPGAPV